jgi:hypothetical protein
MVHAAGEATGYLLGIGSTERQYSLLEVGRDRLVPPSDLKPWT